MLFYIRYTAALGDAAIYTRLRNTTGQFWDFTNLAWVAGETTDCQVRLAERDDGDAVDSLYSAPATLPAGGPWVEETILASNNRVLGYDNTSVPIESSQLTLRQLLFAYIGSTSNVFSKIAGSFVGTLDFYTCSFSAFEANMADPGGTFICKLNASGQMLDVSNVVTVVPIAASGEVLYMKFSSSATSFNCLTATVVNIYNSINKGNTRLYVPLGAAYVASLGAYYPTTASGLLVYENAQLISLGETAYGKALGMIPSINWDRISQPVQLTTTAVIT
jgi:hypothetical protein